MWSIQWFIVLLLSRVSYFPATIRQWYRNSAGVFPLKKSSCGFHGFKTGTKRLHYNSVIVSEITVSQLQQISQTQIWDPGLPKFQIGDGSVKLRLDLITRSRLLLFSTFTGLYLFVRKRLTIVVTVVNKALDDVAEWLAVHQPVIRSSLPSMPQSESQWSRPPPGWVKVNYDGRFSYLNGDVCAGWVIRDDTGTYRLAGSTKLTQATNPLKTKGIVFLHVLQSSWCRGFRKIVLEGDCTTLHDLLHDRISRVTMQHLLVDIRSWADRFTDVMFTVVPRECSHVAAKLAKMAHC